EQDKDLSVQRDADSITNYQLASETFQKRVDAFRSMPAPSVLAGELAIGGACLEQCVNENDMRTSAIWTTCINKLSRSHMSAGLLANELLSKKVVASLAESFLRVIHQEFYGLDGFDDRFQRPAELISSAIQTAENSPSDIPGER